MARLPIIQNEEGSPEAQVVFEHSTQMFGRVANAVRVANQLGLPLVATCDTHYVDPEDAEAQDVLLCINTGKFRTDSTRSTYSLTSWLSVSFAGRMQRANVSK